MQRESSQGTLLLALQNKGEVSTTATGEHRKRGWAVWLQDSLSQPESSLYPLPPADCKHFLRTHLVSGREPKAPQGKEVLSGAPGQYGVRSGVKAEAVGGISPCRNQKTNSHSKPGGCIPSAHRKNIPPADDLHSVLEAVPR